MAERKSAGSLDLATGMVGKSSAPLFTEGERMLDPDGEGSVRPGSGPLRGTQGKYGRDERGAVDELAGNYSRETGDDPFIEGPGQNQFLGHQAVHHGEEAKVTSEVWTDKSNVANRLSGGKFPIQTFVSNGAPNPINPAGTVQPESEIE